MSDLTRFMDTARAVLDDKDRPELFIRTYWLMTELREALEKADVLRRKLSAVFVSNDKPMVMQLNAELAQVIAQSHQLTVWLNQEFEKG